METRPLVSMDTIDEMPWVAMAVDGHKLSSIVRGDGYRWAQLIMWCGWRWLMITFDNLL